MTHQTFEDLMKMAAEVNGKARLRTIGADEARTMLDTISNAPEDAKIIRVYSNHGFVPNSYKYAAEIRAFEAQRADDGGFFVTAKTLGAKRSKGNGALVTINGRAA